GFNPPVNEEKLAEIQQQIGERTIWCASSTHNDEEIRIAQVHKNLKKQIPDLFTLIAPRHPHRGKEIQDAVNVLGLKTALRSAGEKVTSETDIYIADTIGELGLWYTIAPLIFIGGSLIPHGGQNFMEPSRFRNAVVVGPHMHNFTDAMNRAKKADAIIQVSDSEKLEETVGHLLSNPDLLDAKRSLAYNWATGEAKVLDGIVSKVKGFI
ncbi:MAG: 3-deoxy-D-manno-octulosonic acid transferase, partial [Alphaproteobacteria bacterium]|nr:3-deoxy-D-manno-octulosonic acid transferase [Alphaproteobacteria bacterium]